MVRFSHPARFAAICTLAAALGATTLGCAADTESAAEERMAARVHQSVESALDDIDATAEQRQKVEVLEQRLLEEMKTLRGDSQSVHEQVRELWLAERPDPTKAHELVDERLEAVRQSAHSFVDLALELHAVLTPEQRRALAERIEERRARWGHAH